ncbi:hypothetical protein F442_02971 [Phytophthora nicotianae P10297]|uniref:NPP1-like protein n=4 Tax=Phytophthora nicotianae TaxID=4792 RepID=W2QNG4_PHYN3|nr:hypothetical protein PPTG_07671 [Phytophthora nicotianae INRA-310]ETM53700.1 hypothetical protein L914_02852 [Phytophthora nicotianae]ETN14668.1 hypothetical protein PPTG_07671 [Phytophthora nicotianae INRA-310]ETO82867.1 hypothetical protein F444_03044 [Phytophthora nicotianae P1976]ETP51957.1 hypothetical protein F442_02971 [Phytophthora nicotianae P10297]
MNLRAFVLAAIAALGVVHAEVNYINHDEVEPFAQPKPTTDSEKAAVKYKPQFHVSYGCHPYPAVQADGSVSAGLKGSGPMDGECEGSPLGSQVYSRSGWYEDMWAIMYAWYLPKGRSTKYQRRHYWEVAVVWIDDPALANSTILGVSLNYGRRHNSQVPVEEQYLHGSRVKLESFKGFGVPRPRLRFTDLEGETQDLITWEQLTEEARDALSNAKFQRGLIKRLRGDMPLKDGVFEKRLEDAYPFE